MTVTLSQYFKYYVTAKPFHPDFARVSATILKGRGFRFPNLITEIDDAVHRLRRYADHLEEQLPTDIRDAKKSPWARHR